MQRWFKTIPLRLRTLLRKRNIEADLHDEMAFHLAAQVEELRARGYSENEARELSMKAMKIEQQMERCRDERAWQGWERLKADVIFGWRQLRKRKVTTAAAVLSLGLAVGSCMAAFCLIDALFLRPMPVHDPKSLQFISYRRQAVGMLPSAWDSSSYPFYEHVRDTVKQQADAAAAAEIDHIDVTYASDAETEKAYRQWVSGDLFSVLGLQPALGRLLTPDDDRVTEGSPYAVISYDYWTRRFGRDPNILGKTFRMRDHVFEIVGVAPKGFTGTEPGTMTDLFAPVHMEPGLLYKNSFDLRIYLRIHPGTDTQALQARLNTIFQSWEQDRLKGQDPGSPNWVVLQPAGAGASNMQRTYRQSLEVLGVLVLMVLLIACANVANLMAGQAAARAREMALRISLGAGRGRLVRMVLVESAMLGAMAAGLGVLFSAWATPFVVNRINPADDPARLVLSPDWMVVAFGLVLTMGITLLFGSLPALRASAVRPAGALKGGDERHGGMTWMQGMIAAQVAFCFVVLFLAGLFTITLTKLLRQPLGFTSERVVLLDTVTKQAQPPTKWLQLAETLRNVPGVQATAMSDWALMSGTQHNDLISIHQEQPTNAARTFFLGVSPGWFDTMRIPMISGRDFRDSDAAPGNAIVNETLAKKFFGATNPVGQSFEIRPPNQPPVHYEIVGVVKDVVYRDLREKILPQVYLPMQRVDAKNPGALRPIRGEMILVRTASNDPIQMSETLQRAVTQADPEFRVSTVMVQQDLVKNQMIRERLLASLAAFFAVVALLLAAIGLYGVLHYSVVQREKELGIRIALGAAAANIAHVITVRVFVMVLAGAAAGLGIGLGLQRFVETLLYGVHGTDLSMMALPGIVLFAAVSLAALPVVVRAVRIDPVKMLRAE